jgi:hypothetical protein
MSGFEVNVGRYRVQYSKQFATVASFYIRPSGSYVSTDWYITQKRYLYLYTMLKDLDFDQNTIKEAAKVFVSGLLL